MHGLFQAPSSADSADFYDRLMEGNEKRGILGKKTRFNPLRVAQLPSVRKYFVERVRPYLKPTDRILDFGCGPGSFLLTLVPYCEKITGVDISKNFIAEGQQLLAEQNISNAEMICVQRDELPFQDHAFDVLIMVDVIHHLANIKQTVTEAMRVLKPGGRVIIFEPNKLNPLLFLIHLLDRNEWGLLRLGTPRRYRKLLQQFMSIDELSFNGVVIGPQSRLYRYAAELLNSRVLKPILGWLNPKIFIAGKRA